MKELAEWMEDRELELKRQANKPHNLADYLHQDDCQFYSYHKCDVSNPIPVICIGSNFGTGSENMLASCGTCLGQWRSNYLQMRQRLSNESIRADWVNYHWSSESFPTLPESQEMFFIMTNLCPWITSKDWGELSKKNAKALLKSTSFDHVSNLIQQAKNLAGSVAIVGHGVNENIIDELHEYLSGLQGVNWVLYANLTRNFEPTKWNGEKFNFKLGKTVT